MFLSYFNPNTKKKETRVKKKSVTKSTYQPGELKRLKQKTIVYNDLEFTKVIYFYKSQKILKFYSLN